MALPSSGALSLNAIHVEAGGSSGTSASINDSDIRGLISKSSGAQMSFNEWYGASSELWSTNITVGSKNIEIFGTLVAVLYGFADNSVYDPGTGFGSFGSASDSTVDFYSGAALAGLYTRDGSSNSFGLDVGGTQSNSGWSTMTVGSTSLNRTDASFSVGNGVSSWLWTLSGDANPMGTSGTTTVTFV